MLLSCSSLSRLSADDLALEQDTLALVRLRLAERTNFSTNESEQLLVARLEHENRVLVSLTLCLHLDFCGKFDEDRVCVTERELDDIALVGNAVTYTYEFKNLLVAFAYSDNHVVHE